MVLSSTSLYLPGLKRPEGLEDLLQQALSTPDINKVNSTLAQMEELAYKEIMIVPLWDWPVICVYLPVLEDAHWQFHHGNSVRLEWAYFINEEYKKSVIRAFKKIRF